MAAIVTKSNIGSVHVLNGCVFTRTIRTLLQNIRTHPITELTISNCHFYPNVCTEALFQELPCLQSMHVTNSNFFYDRNCNKYLATTTSLQHLTLDSAGVGENKTFNNFEFLVDALRQNAYNNSWTNYNCTIQTLYIANSNIGDQNASLVKLLLETVPINNISFVNCQFTSKGAKDIAKGIELSQGISRISLYNNNIGHLGAAHLIKASAANPNISKLDLRDNPFDRKLFDKYQTGDSHILLK